MQCLTEYIAMYNKMDFANEGLSESEIIKSAFTITEK